MLLYSDAISNDELFSDAFPIKEIDDVVYEVNCSNMTIGAENVDIGANPSADEVEESLEDGGKTVIDIVHAFRLQPTAFDKKAYLTYLKGYMRSVKTKLQESKPDRVEAFEKGAQAYAKKIVADFKNYDCYVGESMNPEGMVALLNYREDGVTPYFTFWKDGLTEVKL